MAVFVLDRTIESARAGAHLIGHEARVILCEGNWLLLDAEPRRTLPPPFDLTAMVEVPRPSRAAAYAHWEHYGLTEGEVAWKLGATTCPTDGWCMLRTARRM